MRKVFFALALCFVFSITTDVVEENKELTTLTNNQIVSTVDTAVSPVMEEQISSAVELISINGKLLMDFPLTTDLNLSLNVDLVVSEQFTEEFSIIENIFTTIDANINTDIAIMIDCDSGAVLYEKNADIYWTAASLSKVFLLHMIMQKVENGEINLDDYLDIDEEEWLGNIPADASVMFLEKGQRVTYRQLIQGLSVVSANDAAYLFVNKLFGGKDNYARIVNDFLAKHGFNQIHLEEPSGLSKYNRITARQFASFCELYLNKNKELLEEVHSLPSFTYPLTENFVEGKKYKYKTTTMKNTNTLIGRYDGVDGLKTGFLSVSGYNLAATAIRDGKRLLVVLLGSKSKGNINGKVVLMEDAKKLFDKGFESFSTDN
ncbi:MAG: serine hydrolase [Candidatus Margulisbacteria bacterium]|nr:serine hydrolase [Candidatus Margulisiibacteriota bacterium]